MPGCVRRGVVISMLLLLAKLSVAQLQTCPPNISFSNGDLSFWGVRTGLVNGSNIILPPPNNGLTIVPEYTIGNTGIEVMTAPTNDLYGSFPTVPTINGYNYGYSIKLGSTSTSWDLRAGVPNPGGFTRAITYTINVPAGPVTVPYTMTYAYAMVLENGTHNSTEQPLFKAILQTADSVVTCASPEYYLPTFNDAGGGGGGGGTGATLDTAAALANGFSLSPVFFLSHAGSNNSGGTLLQDVWTKGWTEVTFDLSPYRGQQVTLTFESDNCRPGAHFAYAYVAVKNTCAGLQISGPPVACTGSTATYTVPTLANGTYNWTVPFGWVINSGDGTNSITVTPGPTGGDIIIQEINGCADLRDTLAVTVSPPTIPGQVGSDNRVCSGTNSTTLMLSGQQGNIINWIFSTNGGTSWNSLGNTTNTYTANNLTTTTQYAALVQNGASCKLDTSRFATITVDPKSVGGQLTPPNIDFCQGEVTNHLISLNGQTGTVVNWQSSPDNINWTGFAPVNTTTTHTVSTATANAWYRVIVQSGVCPADTSSKTSITYYNVPYPVAGLTPPDAYICYGEKTSFNATITTGTSYTWSNAATLTGQGNGQVTSLPFNMNITAAPRRTTDYVLSVLNAGCPNAQTDTFHVEVAPKINVFAGNDTAVVGNQPLQLNATVNDATANVFTWTPAFGLNNAFIHNPIATLSAETGSIMYIVRATNPQGCYGEDNIIVTVFKTGPEIFVPSAFTPNGDGLNDIIRPICVGIKDLVYFRLYNRWGQLVYSTGEIGAGWDGRISGRVQDSNTYVYLAQGIDFLGNTIFRKGTTTLIR
ncbi:MAG: gliding motility-associated C-terminal domain-containing protein [Chitinophagaceae bacterium]|nr:gliding motility-associated C-terminal domain-containing protein [Chitinophagaceae bacterium]